MCCIDTQVKFKMAIMYVNKMDKKRKYDEEEEQHDRRVSGDAFLCVWFWVLPLL